MARFDHGGEISMQATLSRTPLHDWHAAHEGRMVDFAGWSMPVQYRSIVAEHEATRNAAALFDVSHMGRLRFAGSGSGEFLERMLTRRTSDMKPGRVRYSLMTNDAGNVLDDVLIYRLHPQGSAPDWLLVVNAGNREKIVSWVRQHFPPTGVEFHDQSNETAMIAVQGPKAIDLASPLVRVEIGRLPNYGAAVTKIAGKEAVVSRTGYTGEDGCEIILDADEAVGLWEQLLAAGQSQGVMAAGLGARDTLRLEAAMPLYGHELSETTNPVQAGLKFAVDLEGRQFIGRDAIARVWDDPSLPRRVGLQVVGKRAPRENYLIYRGADEIGRVTSGTFSPTLGRPIAMAYVRADLADPGTDVEVDIRGRREPAQITKLPFYSRRKG